MGDVILLSTLLFLSGEHRISSNPLLAIVVILTYTLGWLYCKVNNLVHPSPIAEQQIPYREWELAVLVQILVLVTVVI